MLLGVLYYEFDGFLVHCSLLFEPFFEPKVDLFFVFIRSFVVLVYTRYLKRFVLQRR